MPTRHPKLPLTDVEETPMEAEAFKEWRKRLGLKQKDAAELLGLKKRMIQYYETGTRSGNDVAIPKSIRLACYALEAGILDYDGKLVSAHANNSGVVVAPASFDVPERVNGDHPFKGQSAPESTVSEDDAAVSYTKVNGETPKSFFGIRFGATHRTHPDMEVDAPDLPKADQ
ncbi:MAG: helix-turn-helix transcriptional regulator [Pseudomonadota bacterium]